MIKNNTGGKIFPGLTAGWSWHQRPLAVHYQGKEDKTYIGIVDNQAHVWILSYNHQTGEYKKNRLFTYIKKEICSGHRGETDDHNSPTILIRNSDRRVMVFWAGHFSDHIYYTISKKPEDISSFGSVRTFGDFKNYCYTQPVELTEEGKIYLFCRRDHQSKPQVRVWDIYVSTDDGETFEHNGSPLWYSDDVSAPYAEIYSNSKDTIYFARSDWMKGYRSYVRKNIYFCYYKGGAFYRADHSKIAEWQNLPIIDKEKLDWVFDSDKKGLYSYAKDIGVDDQGNPVIVFTTLECKEDSNNVYIYARWDGKSWNYSKITDGGDDICEVDTHPAYEGGIVLNHKDVNEVVLGKEEAAASAKFQIELWKTDDYGKSWRKEKNISAKHSSEEKNFRPYIPYNHHPNMKYLWLAGKYEFFTDWETNLYFSKE